MKNSPYASTDPARLYALTLRLRPVQAGTLMPFSGEFVHGAFLRWLGSAAPRVADWLHEGQKRRFFTCSSLQFERAGHSLLKAERENIHLPLDPQKVYTVRLTLLLAGLFPLFYEALIRFDASKRGTANVPFIQLGKQLFLLEEVVMANDDPGGWTGFTSLADLVARVREVRFAREATLTLEFASLTAFNRGNNKTGYGSHPLMLPLPQFVFQNLARRWQDIVPPELLSVVQYEDLDDYLQKDGVIIVDYDLKAHHLHFTTHQQRGFVGTCTYQLRGHDEPATSEAPLTLRQQIYLLTLFAFYSGIGYKTAMGLGQARLKV